ncbi:SAM-dependent methyltransferase [Saccharomonospora iraqiensis]|uniref:SAM-dependent methyltransferase n=1 Tax=Saccharomonospora iraqiensis TaxID=52698 RepID=UPI00022E38AD|nr:SAM-dependent methyltransferase [Saccharomonospora iraqiensis]
MEEEPSPTVIDRTRASTARVYDVFLGGKDNYQVDRDVAGAVIEQIPQTMRFAQEHRAWLIRVVRFLAKAGIDQFLDCGSGLPTAENTHQAVQRVNPEARVIYVDNDPTVCAHGRALLEENDRTHFVAGDLRNPADLFADETLTKYLDLQRPIGLIQCSTIHHVPDSDRPHEIMRDYVDLLPSGSYLALTHWHDPADGGEGSDIARFIEETFNNSSMGSGNFRSRTEIERFFTGLEFVEPGLTLLRDWWPDGPHMTPADAVDEIVLAGVARKP